jgi:BirA family biotin operon repressor/biotin-[acetyl-CoA-carboxylase] ligase
MAIYDKSLLRNLLPKCRIEVFNSVGSTQEIAKKSNWDSSGKPLVIIANEQKGGHGKYGRPFYSPANTGIYFSLIMPAYQITPGLFTTGIAVSIYKALMIYFPHKDLQFKWVNDLYLAGKKVGGILIEKESDRLVCGVGLNVSTVQFPKSLKEVASSINQDNFIEREYLLAAIINQIIQDIPSYNNGQHLTLYREKSLLLNQSVSIKVNNSFFVGIATDITNNGELVLKNSTQRYIINSGEVTKIRKNN